MPRHPATAAAGQSPESPFRRAAQALRLAADVVGRPEARHERGHGAGLSQETQDRPIVRTAFRLGARAARHTEPFHGMSSYEFVTRHLGVPAETLAWSLYGGPYAAPDFRWDSSHPDPIKAAYDAMDAGMWCGIEAGTGTNKTYSIACYTLAFVARHAAPKVFTFAPKEDQLRLNLWAEITRLWPRFVAVFPNAHLGDLVLQLRRRSFAHGMARGEAVRTRAGEDSSTAAQGKHAKDMLLVFEEMPGVEQAIVTAMKNTATASNNILCGLGNPDHQHDTLHRFCTSSSRVVHIRISGLDHPNVVLGQEVIPGAVSVGSVEQRKAEYGEDDPFFMSRIRGISPAESSHALIKTAWLDRAQAAGKQRLADEAERARMKRVAVEGSMGVDVANSNKGDNAVKGRALGSVLVRLERVRVGTPECRDCNVLGEQAVAECRALGIPASRLGIDSIGVGAGTVNAAVEKGYRGVRALNGSESAVLQAGVAEEFANLRGQMYWQFRLDLEHGRLALDLPAAEFERLKSQAGVVQWEPKNGVIHVESKESLVKRLPGNRSPDDLDAAVYTNWVRVYRGDASAGGASVGF